MTPDGHPQPTSHLRGADSELDLFLSDRLSEYNATATEGVAPAQELTVRMLNGEGVLVGGVSGWTWGDAAGMGMVWVHPDHRRSGVGALLLRDFEAPECTLRAGYSFRGRWSALQRVKRTPARTAAAAPENS